MTTQPVADPGRWGDLRTRALDPDALEDASHGDGLVEPAMALGNDHALVGLDPLLVALADADAHLDGVTHIDVGQITFELLGLEGPDQVLGARIGQSFSRIRGRSHSTGDVGQARR